MNVNSEILDLRIPFDKIQDENFIRDLLKEKTNLFKDGMHYRILKRSIDARQKIPYFQLRIEISEETFEDFNYQKLIDDLPEVKDKKKIIIIGAGPAGYFAALECLRHGLQPIVLERGKDVRARRRDLKAIQQDAIVNPHSNYCFGEGGAGTYSDGKLYTRSHKRGKIQDVLSLLVAHGAPEEIMVEAHPHIGSNKLPGIVSKIRETIEAKGGQVIFDCYVVDFHINDFTLEAVIDSEGNKYQGEAFILATGHSARDIYELLDKKDIQFEAKPFALGVRIEHPQSLIDRIQYKQEPRSEFLPAAPYKAVAQVDEVGVFSFCMCPGGLIVPAATQPGELVVNGMSLSRRDSAYANSGVVTEVSLQDLEEHGFTGKFAAMNFQAQVEQKLFQAGDGSQQAPAQRLMDFLNGKKSADLESSSYIPGLYSAELHKLLPDWIYNRLRAGIRKFERSMKGYLTNRANVVGLESRTSSTIRIPRDPKTMQHPELKALYPCGEGAGYAGGILSAAMDGQRVVKILGDSIKSSHSHTLL